MGMESLLCEKCKGKLEIDPQNSSVLVCTSCRTKYSLKLNEVIINNYSPDTIQAEVVNIVNDESRDARVKAAEGSLVLGKYDDARRIFAALTKDHADDYRGWLGLIKVDSKNFSKIPVPKALLAEMKSNYENARKMANAKELSSFEKQVELYFSQLETDTRKKLETLTKKKSAARKSIDAYTEEYKQKDAQHQAQLEIYNSDVKNIEHLGKTFRTRFVVIALAVLLCFSLCILIGWLKKYDGLVLELTIGLLLGIVFFLLFIKIVADLNKDSCEKKIVEVNKQIDLENQSFAEETKTYNQLKDSLQSDISNLDMQIEAL